MVMIFCVINTPGSSLVRSAFVMIKADGMVGGEGMAVMGGQAQAVVDDLKNAGNKAFKEKDWDKAIECYDCALELEKAQQLDLSLPPKAEHTIPAASTTTACLRYQTSPLRVF